MIDIGNIEATGLWVGNKKADAAYVGVVKVWEKSAPTPDWLCFTAEEANSTVAMAANGSAPTVSLEYSTNGSTWSPFVVGTTTVTLANIGDKVYVRATSAGNTGMSTSPANSNRFVMTGKIAASGNVDTLLDQTGNATLTNYCYAYLFNGCTSLTTAPVLPATTLTSYCYSDMFNSCTSLTAAPALPATTLADRCYYHMFQGCTYLTTAPELPATTLAEYCYSAMFRGCTSLTTAPELPATTLAQSCYSNMFYGCTSLTSAPALPVTTLANGCYSAMFQGCTSLTTAPELPATTLAQSCYSNMFYGCTSLTTAPELPATTLANGCYNNMFQGCTSLTTAPELPATTLVYGCYYGMFNSCSNLNSITLGYTGNFADAPSYAFYNWVSGVAASGTFYYDGTDTTTGTSAIPVGWTVLPIPIPELCFTAREANATVSMIKGTNAPTLYLQTSVDDGETWQTFTAGSTTITLANIGDRVMFRTTPGRTNSGTAAINSWYRTLGANSFSFGGQVKVSGRLESLLYPDFVERDDITLPDYCFWRLFYGCPDMRGTIDCSHIGSCGQSTFGETFSEDGISSSRWSIENVDFSGLHTIYAANPASGPATQLSSSTFYATFDSCNSMSCLSLPNLTNDGLSANQCGNMNNICYNCSGLEVVDLSNLKQLYSYGLFAAFMNCVGLRKVYLTNLSAMGALGFDQTFKGCTMLELVDFSNAAAVPSVGTTIVTSSTFANTNNTYKVVVPDALYNDWVSNSGWSPISSHIVKASEYTPT